MVMDERERPADRPASDSTGPQEAAGEKGKLKEIEKGTSDRVNEAEAEAQGSSDEADDSDQSEDDEGSKDAATTAAPSTGAWQAIYSPQFNAYYFYNSETQETTWTNPLAASNPASASTSTFQESEAQPSSSASAAASVIDPRFAAMQEAAIAQGIDPALAYLDPSLGAPIPSASVGPGGVSFSAKFNARTGQFTRPDGRDPTHVSEYERMKRMSQFYFDVGAWESQLATQGGSIKGDEATKKRKRPSKKDLERFKEQKRLKKIAKTAWLRT